MLTDLHIDICMHLSVDIYIYIYIQSVWRENVHYGSWVAVKDLKLSYCNKEAQLFIYP